MMKSKKKKVKIGKNGLILKDLFPQRINIVEFIFKNLYLIYNIIFVNFNFFNDYK